MARLLFGRSRSCGGPRRAGVRRRLHQLGYDHVQPTYGLPGRALEALVLLVAVLIVTIVLLVPAQGMVLAGAEVLAVGVVDWAVVVTIQLLVLRNWRLLEPAFRWHFVP